MTGPLNGYTIGVTADRRSEEQISLLEGRGGECLHGPTVQIHPLRPEGEIAAATTLLIEQPPDLLIATTGIGVRGWIEAADALLLGESLREALGKTRILARGPKAHGAVITAGLDVEWTAPEGTSAEVVDRLRQEVPPLRVAVQVDGAPDPALVDTLTALGHDVVPVPVYRWSTPDDPKPATTLVRAVADQRVDAITFTSRPAAENFLSLADDLDLAAPVMAALAGPVSTFCVGPVCAEAISERCGIEPIQPSRPRLGALVMAVTSELSSRRSVIRLAGTEVAIQGRMALIDGDKMAMLSARESQVLSALGQKPGAVVSKATLLSTVWGAAESDPHVVEVTIGRLRRRLGPAGLGIETVMRRGYRASAD